VGEERQPPERVADVAPRARSQHMADSLRQLLQRGAPPHVSVLKRGGGPFAVSVAGEHSPHRSSTPERALAGSRPVRTNGDVASHRRAVAYVIVNTPFIPAAAWPGTVHW